MTRASKITWLLIAVASLLPHGAAAASEGSDLDDLTAWMTGTFSTAVQALEDPEHLELSLHLKPVWIDRLDGRWIYVEQSMAEYPDSPYRQRVYHLDEPTPGLFEIRVFSLPDPPAVVGAWREETPLTEVGPDDLELREGCEILLRRRGESFAGSTLASLCSSTLRDAMYAASEVLITPDGMISRDRGFAEDGSQVWGPTGAGYVFDRIVGDPEASPESESTPSRSRSRSRSRTMITVKSLHIYPVKSCGGISLESAEVIPTGFRWDRRWMVVDPDRSFLSQRTHPIMATVATRIESDQLVLTAPARSDLAIDLAEPTRHSQPVTVWDDTCHAVSEGGAAADWFSGLLDTPCDLVRQTVDERRSVDPRFAEPKDIVSFADGFPFLLLSEASVDELNRRLEAPVSADRFRANIIVQGCAPHAEDSWRALEIGSVTFRVSKPCARCVIVDTDQHDGSRTTEPLRTLAGYRKADGKILFGQNLLHRDTGTLAIGDTVTTIDEA